MKETWFDPWIGKIPGEGMANHFSILALRTHEQYERQNDRILKEELPRSVRDMLLEISGEITLERMKGWSQGKNNTQLWM